MHCHVREGRLKFFISADSGDGSCLVYDNYQFSVFMTSVSVTMKLLSLACYCLSLLASRKSRVPDVDLGAVNKPS